MESPANVTVQLLGRYRQGDSGAVNELYRRYFDRLHAVVRLRIGAKLRQRIESMDVVQDAFLASLKGLDEFEYRGEGDFFHWLCRITENRIRDQADYHAAARRDVGKEKPLESGRPSCDSVFGPIAELMASTTPSGVAATAEDLARLEQAIDDLPDPQREALLLVRYEGLSLAEAGQRMNRTPDAVRMMLARGMIALSRRLAPEDRSPDSQHHD